MRKKRKTEKIPRYLRVKYPDLFIIFKNIEYINGTLHCSDPNDWLGKEIKLDKEIDQALNELSLAEKLDEIML